MKKASEYIKYYKNENGPVIGVTKKPVIEKDGMFFKDLMEDGILRDFEDWRKSPKERAESLAKELSADEKIGLIFTNSWKMGLFQTDKTKVDSTGLLNEEIVEKDESIFNIERTYGTTYTIRDLHIRHLILRTNPQPDQLADWINEMNRVAEETVHGVPVLVLSNSRNENGEVIFGMNDATGVFATYPGTLGIAAAIKGSSIDIIDDFAKCVKEDWNAVGMKKGYFYMADVVTVPRWQRTYGTFGEDPKLITQIFERLIPGIQGSDHGVTTDGVAMTVKHFPGGGARENGFDPHYKQGCWNIYQTENSLQKYHLPPFKVAVEKMTSSIMPYYAKPNAEKSGKQYGYDGKETEMVPLGFAYNHYFIQTLLRDQMGFKGYVNSDSGISHFMSWGVEKLDVPARIALAINNGVDIISGALSVEEAKIAYNRGKNGYYTTQVNPVPEGFSAEQLVLTDEALTRAVSRTLEEQFALGLFDNPYRDPQEAVRIVKTKEHWDKAYECHLKSVVLLKNKGNVLPLTENIIKDKKVYINFFHKQKSVAKGIKTQLRKTASEKYGLNVVNSYTEADYAILFVSPSSGNYFKSTQGYLELDICEEKTVVDIDADGKPEKDKHHNETTLTGAKKIPLIADAIHKNGGKVISCINFPLAWIVGNVEKHSDAVLAGFDTFNDALLDVICGKYNPTGKMPITLPRNDDVIRVQENGVCISRNDVPGYDKDKYLPNEMKDENGKAYAYRDECGNYYELDFGLSY